ncbi:MAG TPA: tetratricopeptide repeat protein [Candidatus Binatia bacterium]|jgi:tetratricopeptide (TPR) repeat protein|nr:tetratricopeptide repeat protein [Candidatus Binatia bacterium]
MKNHFTTREVAKILSLSESRIRSCIRSGFLSPIRSDRNIEFSFQDLLLLKTMKGLLDAQVPLKRIRRILHSLRQQLPEAQQVWNVTVYTDGKRVVAWDGGARWQPDSGQFLFNFAAQEVAKRVKLVFTTNRQASARSTEQWFDLGCELEKDSPEEARRAYHQALSLDPSMTEAHINLGRLYHQAGDFEKAEAHYRAAIARAPDDALAHFNLGVLLEERGRPAEAIGAYREAIKYDPNFADAHYNLALIFEAKGRRSEAIKHFRSARELYGPIGRNK